MPRTPRVRRKKAGCPKKDIDWKEVDNLLMCGCPATIIGDAIGIASTTLYERCVRDNGINFSKYAQQKISKGDGQLYVAQFNKAIKGSDSLLIHLGKTRLGQKEERVEIPPNDQHLKLEDENIKLREELRLLKEKLGLDAQPETGTELPTSDSTI